MSFIPSLKIKGKNKNKSKDKDKDKTMETDDMPQATGSCSISDTLRVSIRERDDEGCIICGNDPVEVAHIIGKTNQVDYQVQWRSTLLRMRNG
jgi:hypothetical protein